MHPFLQFPQLFFLAPEYVPVLLRIAATVVFAHAAYAVYKNRAGVAKISLPVVGVQSWAVSFVILVYSVIVLMLVCGYYTQFGALLGTLAALKELVWGKRMRPLFPISRTSAFLLMIICLALVFMGAGAFAFDLPL
jgi:hypothetical protein